MFQNNKEFPEPYGDYVVGLTEMDFIDKNRKKLFGSSENNDRKIPIIIFYPADHNFEKTKALYTFKEEAESINKATRGLVSSKSQYIKMNCYRDIPISTKQNKYPIIFFNHGYNCHMMQNSVLCSDLASKGYIVVSVGHPYETSILKYTDGQIVKANKSIIEEFKRTMDSNVNKKFKEMKKNNYIDEELLPIAADFFDYFKDTKVWDHVKIWSDDNRFIADMMEQLDDGSIPSQFEGKLNIRNGIGITGHSYGGCAASQVCLDDSRFVCGINIDAPTYGEFWDKNLNKPYMVIGSKMIEYLARTTFLKNSADSYLITVDHTTHMDFTDFIYYARQLKFLKVLGKRKKALLRDILSHYHIMFFDKYLRNNHNSEITEKLSEGIGIRWKEAVTASNNH
ncbi:alpha/beta hydrolase [Alkalicoccobacillus murimartini]|uniref:1-alkyl-2-acetylglycerophosphocholine esterase n=1 Tax=Alkalicoccobacillus murimartini TaxID=171685 RepID=A0ABT9YLW9_9BACI|nr:hypothetical protein [Alkalicoccobacillus murimartini]MDQ0208588.1 hypothetical protein [Alkalicoccobacillus murimartini]